MRGKQLKDYTQWIFMPDETFAKLQSFWTLWKGSNLKDNKGQTIVCNWAKDSDFFSQTYLRSVRGLSNDDCDLLFQEVLDGKTHVKVTSDYKGDHFFKTRAKTLRTLAFLRKEVYAYVDENFPGRYTSFENFSANVPGFDEDALMGLGTQYNKWVTDGITKDGVFGRTPQGLARMIRNRVQGKEDTEVSKFQVELTDTRGQLVCDALPVSLIFLDTRSIVPMWDPATLSHFFDTAVKNTTADSFWIVCLAHPEHNFLLSSVLDNLDSRSRVFIGVYEDHSKAAPPTGITEPHALIYATKIQADPSSPVESLDLMFCYAEHPQQDPDIPSTSAEGAAKESEQMVEKLTRSRFRYNWQGMPGDLMMKSQLVSPTALYLVQKLVPPGTGVFDYFSCGALGRAALQQKRFCIVAESDPAKKQCIQGILGRIDNMLSPVLDVQPITEKHPGAGEESGAGSPKPAPKDLATEEEVADVDIDAIKDARFDYSILDNIDMLNRPDPDEEDEGQGEGKDEEQGEGKDEGHGEGKGSGREEST